MDALWTELWRKIDAFQVDDPSSELTFTDRLARENDWSLAFADRVVREYKRFIFLAATASHRVTPSELVDEAWHLHLIYTRSYWDELCRNVIRRPLHHGPTKGGRAETQRFHEQYRKTLASYRDAFGEDLPSDIWPSGETAKRKPRYKRVNLTDAWVIPKPWAVINQFVRKHAGVALCVSPLTLAIVNPFDLTGQHFLQFFPCLMGVAVVISLLLRHTLKPNEDSSKGELTPYQVACLADGKPGLVRAAIVSLIDRGAIEVGMSKSTGVGKYDYRIKVRHGVPDSAEDVDKRIIAACSAANGRHLGDAARAAEPAAEKMDYRLQAWGLRMPTDKVVVAQIIPFLIMLCATSVGVIKIFVGLSRGKPVAFLLAMVVVAAMLSVLFLIRPGRTRAGDDRLKRIRQQQEMRVSMIPGKAARLSGDDLIVAAALFGLPAIAAGELALMPQAWKYRNGPPAPGSSSGCGATDCGGGGGCGGGGCGGGGCGGCGGS